jgi:multiple sugar transport system ATP-binding protein
MAGLNLNNVKKSYGKVDIIKGVDLEIKHGEFVVFVGPSGCGKSTLLRMIAGLEDITDGTVAIGNKVVNELQPKDRSIAMVFQSYALFPHMTVYDNVGFGLKIAGEPKDQIDLKVKEAARILKMENLLERKPAQLSGGQRQRVAIGRAIVRKPDVFLFDEPLSNLDAALRVNTRAEIAKLHRDLEATMIYVTHDQVEAMTLADRIVVLEAGKVRQYGAPLALYHKPDNQFVAGFIGSPKMNFVKVSVDAATAKSVTVSSKDISKLVVPVDGSAVSKGTSLTLGIRPEHISVADGKTRTAKGRVELIERLGHQSYIESKLSTGESLSALIDGTTLVGVGDDINLGFDGDDCHLFLENGEALDKLKVPEVALLKRGQKSVH